MSQTIQTLVLEYDEEQRSEECPLMYVEIPENEVGPGDEVEIRLWGPAENLSGWSLCIFGDSLGSGELQSLENPEFIQQVDLVESLEAQLEYPLMQLTHVTALTPLVCIDSQTPYPPLIWQNAGSDLTALCSRKGYSCLQVESQRPLYGSLEVGFERVSTYRRWFWTIPSEYYGDIWFFLYDDTSLEPYRKFAVELPELAIVEQGVRNVSIKCVDFSTDAVVAGASVYLDGNYQGVTDAAGLLHLSDVATGEHHFQALAEGYLDTQEDGLSNDSIVVK